MGYNNTTRKCEKNVYLKKHNHAQYVSIMKKVDPHQYSISLWELMGQLHSSLKDTLGDILCPFGLLYL